jgi:hypothetical protein
MEPFNITGFPLSRERQSDAKSEFVQNLQAFKNTFMCGLKRID